MPARQPHRPTGPADDHDNARLRRAHRKSRGGCLNCKRRHVKCDEGRPSCLRCARTNRDCTYKDAARNSTPPQTTADNSRERTPGQAEGSAATDETSEPLPSITEALNDFMLHPTSDSDALPVSGWPLTREHMALLQHAEEYALPFNSLDASFQPMIKGLIETAWTAPYLMDLVLALAALHLAELNPSRADRCRQQAMQLQTRGLMLFNEAKEDILPDTCLPMFFFTSVVGTTVLYDVIRNHQDSFTNFLDRFVSYLRLHSGVSVITNRSWSTIQSLKIRATHKYFPKEAELNSLIQKGTECNPLDAMLDGSDLNTSAAQACRCAVKTLRHAFAFYQHLSMISRHQSSGPMAFASRADSLFIDLAEQRQPEALIILAYYAVLLHWCRDFWIFGDAGEFMIRGISRYVGKYWQKWLAFPNSVLENIALDNS